MDFQELLEILYISSDRERHDRKRAVACKVVYSNNGESIEFYQIMLLKLFESDFYCFNNGSLTQLRGTNKYTASFVIITSSFSGQLNIEMKTNVFR